MTIWKKAASVSLSATLLASLLVTTFAGAVLANSAPQALSGVCNPVGCSQVAGSGLIVLNGSTNTFTAADATTGSGARKLTVSGAGATFVASTGSHFTVEAATDTSGNAFYLAGEVKVATGVALSAGDTLSVLGASAGTATITEWFYTGSTGSPANTWLPDGNTWALTFTASTTGYQVSAALSTVVTWAAADCTTAKTAAAAVGGTAYVCVTVYNTLGAPVLGASVTVTSLPFGMFGGLQTTSGTTNAAGLVSFLMTGSGLAGVSTISATATYLGVTTALAPATFTWTGTPSTLTLANKKFTGTNTLNAKAFYVQATDAAGNSMPQAGATLTSSPAGLVVVANATAGYYDATCPNATTETVYTVTATLASPVLTSNTVKYVCNPDVTATLVLTPASKSIPAGGSTTFTVTGKDALGNPIADGTIISAIASAGAVLGDTTINTSTTSNGVASFLYLAVNANGPVTLTGVDFVSGLTATNTIGVGQPAAVVVVVVTGGSAASHLGITTSGPFTTATKIPAIGKYVTVKFTMGAAAAGAHVIVRVATKHGTVWSAWVNVTTRIADSSGNVYYYYRSFSAAWLSFRVDGGTTCQARWM